MVSPRKMKSSVFCTTIESHTPKGRSSLWHEPKAICESGASDGGSGASCSGDSAASRVPATPAAQGSKNPHSTARRESEAGFSELSVSDESTGITPFRYVPGGTADGPVPLRHIVGGRRGKTQEP